LIDFVKRVALCFNNFLLTHVTADAVNDYGINRASGC